MAKTLPPRRRGTRRQRTRTPCPVEAYARAVLEGRIVAGRLVRLACQRHTDDLATGASRGLLWDPTAARHALDFFGHLRHSTGEWAHQPFVLQPWQAFVVGSLFGWKRRAAPLPHRLRRGREKER